jgi:hypothetical protein
VWSKAVSSAISWPVNLVIPAAATFVAMASN